MPAQPILRPKLSAHHLPIAVLALSMFGMTPPASAAGDAAIPTFSGAPVGPPPPGWVFSSLPRKTPTAFSIVDLDGSHVLKATADDSYGYLVHTMNLPIGKGATISWRWRVDQLVEGANLKVKDGEDSPAKVCVFFAFDADRLSFGERAKLAVGRASTGEDLPAEALCYAWGNKVAVGTTLSSAFTDRIRFIVLESGSARLGQWMTQRRDLAADYLRVFGDEADGKVPAVSGIAVGADADNTHAHGLSYFGDVTLSP